MRRAAVLTLCLTLIPGLALCEDVTAEVVMAQPPAGVMITTSISLNLPLTAADQAGKLAEEETRRKELYARSVRECDILMETVAKSCTITGINVSTQTNSSPGQPDYLYASSNISMQVELN